VSVGKVCRSKEGYWSADNLYDLPDGPEQSGGMEVEQNG
jgi:hypothetical protein